MADERVQRALLLLEEVWRMDLVKTEALSQLHPARKALRWRCVLVHHRAEDEAWMRSGGGITGFVCCGGNKRQISYRHIGPFLAGRGRDECRLPRRPQCGSAALGRREGGPMGRQLDGVNRGWDAAT
ncbi:hypothetical protein NDU88_003441 [Pleurodeles waltl]|uniref:Uncharacterized protein n=1 Tax=Pleurodeles waltl TaxID=8319 RepID=A0AAV7UE24_PLEWA|nr:hypothetical protein NDU88_003441 [Pleurodeles waltl]